MHLLAIPKSILIQSIKTMLKSLHVLLGLPQVWNCYSKGGYKKGTT